MQHTERASIYLSDAWWMMLYPMLVPMLELLPDAITSPWLQSVSFVRLDSS